MEFSVYPRWRGEHPHYAGIVREKSGLSPLARGTRRLRAALFLCLRFIPAGAGNTNSKWMSASYQSVYPRWRGEHLSVAWKFNFIPGLSPLARGTRAALPVARVVTRFIPAGAGNTPNHAAPLVIAAVYPRWRGEHCIPCQRQCGAAGLSPLARGTRTCAGDFEPQSRFIPAGAGNTESKCFPIYFFAVYPRWRGEHACQRLFKPAAERFIPAGAGNTNFLNLFFSRNSVYPRWRGEHPPAPVSISPAVGLSPLARGTPSIRYRCAPALRFIPAGAGNTLSIHNCF